MAEKISFYFDEHMPRAVEQALVKRGFSVVMAVDIGMTGKDDDTEHLVFAAARDLVLVTRDRPFAGRTSGHTDHAGLVCWTGKDDDFGGMIRALSNFGQTHSLDTVRGQVFWLRSE